MSSLNDSQRSSPHLQLQPKQRRPSQESAHGLAPEEQQRHQSPQQESRGSSSTPQPEQRRNSNNSVTADETKSVSSDYTGDGSDMAPWEDVPVPQEAFRARASSDAIPTASSSNTSPTGSFRNSRRTSGGLITLGKSVMVLCKGVERTGVIRFTGPTTFHPGPIWVGVELDQAAGSNDGSLRGVTYFRCKQKHGIFVRPDAVLREHDPLTSSTRRHRSKSSHGDRRSFMESQLAMINERLRTVEPKQPSLNASLGVPTSLLKKSISSNSLLTSSALKKMNQSNQLAALDPELQREVVHMRIAAAVANVNANVNISTPLQGLVSPRNKPAGPPPSPRANHRGTKSNQPSTSAAPSSSSHSTKSAHQLKKATSVSQQLSIPSLLATGDGHARTSAAPASSSSSWHSHNKSAGGFGLKHSPSTGYASYQQRHATASHRAAPRSHIPPAAAEAENEPTEF